MPINGRPKFIAKRLSIAITEEIYAAIRQEVEQTGLSQAVVVRNALMRAYGLF